MASLTIEKRKKSNGEYNYRALVRVKKSGVIIHRESKTFTRIEHARTWGKRRIEQIEVNGLKKYKTVTLGELLNLYYEDHDLWSKTGRTKRYVIKMLMDCDLSQIDSNELRTSHLIEHCRHRRNAGASPPTIYHDIAYLRSVMKKAMSVWDITANYQIFEDAVPTLIDMGLVGKSQKRTRRPTDNELEVLRLGLQKRMEYRPNGATRIPYLDILDFSLLTCMRIGEVCKITWDDLNTKHKTVIVRDRKDPRKKEGNHMIVPLLGGSFDIVKRQPKTDERIFPYNPRSVASGFQRVRNELGIEDLRYHDLRREGASRLFEKGYSIEEVAQVTGHRNLNILWQVYTQLFPHKLHDKEDL
ncbi:MULTISPECIES: tyrosine-type recombinase/integrase [unclassified Pseudoalteromonas]|uniref:tyrosine-type recombinase/integrase n=1 Tax=unclassified Pseudoalteromonas TaxID=194690 RepID=UPI001F3A94EB|nr:MULTISPECIES: site-specific integrase [unclassified Pseudoalteromonas]MCF2825694.1 site-specific integrase [Pseudoalteromonas sp. OF5H-5]MCF2833792.1 site-specific integrase [Pseudoalteromonas sp. DL2-H6]MCF2923746.1 site-specific integrase [Pseudoalteromonas sp. DL2-H1]